MIDQHAWFFKHFEPSDYDELLVAAHRLGAQSVEDVWIIYSISGCFDNGDRLTVSFKIVSLDTRYTAVWKQTADWFLSGAKQRELVSVRQD